MIYLSHHLMAPVAVPRQRFPCWVDFRVSGQHPALWSSSSSRCVAWGQGFYSTPGGSWESLSCERKLPALGGLQATPASWASPALPPSPPIPGLTTPLQL